MLKRTVVVGLVGLAIAIFGVEACSSNDSSDTSCQAGDQTACTCDDGQKGMAQCVNGALGACQCDGTSEAGAEDSGGGGGGSDSGQGGGDGGHEGGGKPATTDGGVGEYMGPCTSGGTCADGLMCFDFTAKGQFCTKSCQSNDDCPAPSPKCNGRGVCAIPD